MTKKKKKEEEVVAVEEPKEEEEVVNERKDGVAIDVIKRVCFPVYGYFPTDKWTEYNKSVMDDWGGSRWAKAWHDHEASKNNVQIDALWAAILEIKAQLVDAEEATQEKKDDEQPRTLGKRAGEE